MLFQDLVTFAFLFSFIETLNLPEDFGFQ